jgi:hypothetical protein
MNNEQTHYTIDTTLNGQRIGHQEIHDPFVTHTIEISWRALLAALLRHRGARVIVRLNGDRHAVHHVMQPIPILPDLTRRHGGEESMASNA